MRKSVLVSGLFLVLFGLVFMVASTIAVQPEPFIETQVLDKTTANPPADSLSVQGNLSNGDRFRIGFTIDTSPGQIHVDAAVILTVTNPEGYNLTDEIPIGFSPGGKPISMAPFPEGIANKTGTYKVSAQGIWFVYLRSLVLEKAILKEGEAEYPYRILFPIGIATITGGVGTSLLGAKSSKPRKIRSKRRSLKRKR